MKNKKLTVSIGIPAYNEEANIGYLLDSLINQKEIGFKIDKILVASDASTDRTVQIVKGFKNKRIRLLNNKDRQGQASRQNQIVRHFTGDIFVLLEADTLPVDVNFIKNLIEPFKRKNYSHIGLTYGTAIPLPPRNFFEKIMYFKTDFKKRIQQEIIKKNHMDECSGHRGRAFSKEFVQKIHWLSDTPEDTYSFLLCNRMGYEIVNTPKAEIYYRLPGNFRDYCRQYSKYLRGKNSLSQYHSLNQVVANYQICTMSAFKESIKTGIKNPLMMFLYISVLLLAHFSNIRSIHFHPFTEIYLSSKKLVECEHQFSKSSSV